MENAGSVENPTAFKSLFVFEKEEKQWTIPVVFPSEEIFAEVNKRVLYDIWKSVEPQYSEFFFDCEIWGENNDLYFSWRSTTDLNLVAKKLAGLCNLEIPPFNEWSPR